MVLVRQVEHLMEGNSQKLLPTFCFWTSRLKLKGLGSHGLRESDVFTCFNCATQAEWSGQLSHAWGRVVLKQMETCVNTVLFVWIFNLLSVPLNTKYFWSSFKVHLLSCTLVFVRTAYGSVGQAADAGSWRNPISREHARGMPSIWEFKVSGAHPLAAPDTRQPQAGPVTPGAWTTPTSVLPKRPAQPTRPEANLPFLHLSPFCNLSRRQNQKVRTLAMNELAASE